MIAIFEHIRDIPYSLATDPGLNVPATAPGLLLKLGRGNCTPKHYLLATMYKKLNLSVIFATFPFLWNDPEIRYPSELRDLAALLPVAYHLACRVQIGCRWVLVDATWDRPLAKAGFPVNMHWDGYADTRCAVKPLRSATRTAYCRTLKNEPCRDGSDADLAPVDGEKDHWEGEDRARFYNEKVAVRSPDEIERTRRFYRGFEDWIVEVRGQKN
jgi:hypothetical protein